MASQERLSLPPQPEIVWSSDVPHRLVDMLKKAQQFAYIKTLQFAPTDEIATALETASSNGVDVAVFADNPYQTRQDLLLSMSDYYESLPHYIQPTFRWANPLINWLKDLKVKGFSLRDVILREHDKAISIDGHGLVGGVNINPYDFNRKDFLVQFPPDTPIAKAVHKYLEAQVKGKPFHSAVINPDTEMLVESHRPFDWGIYDQACRWVDNADQPINLITPLMPIGRLLHLLLVKSKNIPVSINLSSADDMWYTQTPYKELLQISLRQMELPIYRGHQLYVSHASERTHAKVLQVGSQIMFGSHNFWEPGIFGLNREMIIATSNSELVNLVTKATKK